MDIKEGIESSIKYSQFNLKKKNVVAMLLSGISIHGPRAALNFPQNAATAIKCSGPRMTIAMAIDIFGLVAGHANPASVRYIAQSPGRILQK